jgi:hypothetical protein
MTIMSKGLWRRKSVFNFINVANNSFFQIAHFCYTWFLFLFLLYIDQMIFQ